MRQLILRSAPWLFAISAACSLVCNTLNQTTGTKAMGSGITSTDGTKIADPNALAATWEGPYGGVPPFDRVQIALFKPALEAAMAEDLSDRKRHPGADV